MQPAATLARLLRGAHASLPRVSPLRALATQSSAPVPRRRRRAVHFRDEAAVIGWLRQTASTYLERYPSTSENLRRVLRRRLTRIEMRQPGLKLQTDGVAAGIEKIVEELTQRGFLNDARFAEARVASLRRQGKSLRAIRHGLMRQGVPQQLAVEALESSGDVAATREGAEEAEEREFESAMAYARRRRIGPFRRAGEREDEWQRDVARLARQGFSFQIARRVLGAPRSDANVKRELEEAP